MFSSEMILILIVALVLIGPSKLPEIVKMAAKGLSEIRRLSLEVKSTLQQEVERIDAAKRIEEAKKEYFGDLESTLTAPIIDPAPAPAEPEPVVQEPAQAPLEAGENQPTQATGDLPPEAPVSEVHEASAAPTTGPGPETASAATANTLGPESASTAPTTALGPEAASAEPAAAPKEKPHA